MIIVTGGAGMIGSNIIKALNDLGYNDILVVDDLKDGTKFANLVDMNIEDYINKQEFMDNILASKNFNQIEVVFHQGACSKTTEWDGNYMMNNNYEYSKNILHFCINGKIPFIYASSAAIYGNRKENFIEKRQYEKPINIYGYSKMLFDHYVRRILPKVYSPICGLRYFNVYGPREEHKRNMASIIFHLNTQIKKGEDLKLFAGSNNFRRDFIYVNDVVSVNLWCWENHISGIYNCGTGCAVSFQEIAQLILKSHNKKNSIKIIPFPVNLQGHYQQFTQANLRNLRQIGYTKPFKKVAEGINTYITYLNNQ